MAGRQTRDPDTDPVPSNQTPSNQTPSQAPESKTPLTSATKATASVPASGDSRVRCAPEAALHSGRRPSGGGVETRRPRVGVVGARRCRHGIGEHVARHLVAQGAEVPAIVGTSPQTVRQAQDHLGSRYRLQPRGYTSLAGMLSGEQLDAVAICSPDRFHRQQLRECLAAGVHVLCEKPLVFDPQRCSEEDAIPLIEGFAQAGLVLMVNQQWPYTLPAFEQLFPNCNFPAPQQQDRPTDIHSNAIHSNAIQSNAIHSNAIQSNATHSAGNHSAGNHSAGNHFNLDQPRSGQASSGQASSGQASSGRFSVASVDHLEMLLGPSLPGFSMLPDALPHVFSLLLHLCPPGGQACDPEITVVSTQGTDITGQRLRFIYDHAEGSTEVIVHLRQVSEQPRPSGYAINRQSVRRLIQPGVYRMYLEALPAGHTEFSHPRSADWNQPALGPRVFLPDPLVALLEDFVQQLQLPPQPYPASPQLLTSLRLLDQLTAFARGATTQAA